VRGANKRDVCLLSFALGLLSFALGLLSFAVWGFSALPFFAEDCLNS
jgi:hypothetical protein